MTLIPFNTTFDQFAAILQVICAVLAVSIGLQAYRRYRANAHPFNRNLAFAAGFFFASEYLFLLTGLQVGNIAWFSAYALRLVAALLITIPLAQRLLHEPIGKALAT